MIKSISITGFRGIAETLPLDFGRITLLSGRNGLGKTTVFDAIDWCLFGGAWRLGSEPNALRNIYRTDLSPNVRIELQLPNGKLLIERTEFSVFLNENEISDRELVESLMIDAEGIAPYARDVESRLRRLVYLSQEDVRAAVHPDDSGERTSLFQAILGVPNASVMRSGVRRIGDHLRHREQDLRSQLGQLRLKKNDLQTVLDESQNQALDVARLVSEASAHLNEADGLSIDELGKRTRRELDILSSTSIRLDDALSAIFEFRERRNLSANAMKELSQEIERVEAAEREAVSANEKALGQLESRRQANHEAERTLAVALRGQNRLKEQIALQQRLGQLIREEEQAQTAVRTATDGADRIRVELQQFRQSSSIALDRRAQIAKKKSTMQNALDRAQDLLARQKEEAHLTTQIASFAGQVHQLQRDKESSSSRLEEAQEELNNRRYQLDALTATTSQSDTLESLLRQVASILPADAGRCPLCGTSFESRVELLRHISETREQRVQATVAISDAFESLQQQQNTLEELERGVRDIDTAIATANQERNRRKNALERIGAELARLSKETLEPVEGSIETIDDELQQIDEDLRSIRSDIDDRTARLNAAEEDLARTTSRSELLTRNVASTRQNLDANLNPQNLAQELELASDDARRANTAAQAASEAEKIASEEQTGTERSLRAIRERLVDLRSRRTAVLEKTKAETATLLAGTESEGKRLGSVEEAAQSVEAQRVRVAERLATMKRLWADLLVAGTEEKAKANRLQSAALDREIITQQGNLDRLLRAQGRFEQIAGSLEETAESEAADALQQQRQAIQECFTAMYPYAHLNKILIGDEPLGRVTVTDRHLSDGVEPAQYLSTGQANVLALSYFLGIALRQRLLKIGLVCLDEPVQHLDDLHFLGFVSLLKRVGLNRQVVLSTADGNVAEIITRQLQSTWAEASADFVRYDWQSFDPNSGPRVVRHDGIRKAVA